MTDLSQALQHLIQTFMHQSMHKVITYVKTRGLSMSQMGTLLLLHRQESCAVSDIGEYLGITSAASSQLLNRLVEEGWVKRSEDPDDRRHKLLELTPAGREMVRESMEIRQSWIVSLVDTLTPSEQAEVEKSIRLLLSKVDQMEDERIIEDEK